MLDFRSFKSSSLTIMTCIRYYLSYSLSYRQISEIMAERGINICHTTIYRWVIKLVPFIEKLIKKDRHPVGASWRMDETYIKVNKGWKYLYRAVDKKGFTIDFLLTANRDTKAASRFLQKAIKSNGGPSKVTIDKSGASKAAIEKMNRSRILKAEIRQVKYLNNIVEQDHRNIKRIIHPMMGFKTFRTAKITITGIEIAAMFRKKQISLMELFSPTPIQQWQLLAGNTLV